MRPAQAPGMAHCGRPEGSGRDGAGREEEEPGSAQGHGGLGWGAQPAACAGAEAGQDSARNAFRRLQLRGSLSSGSPLWACRAAVHAARAGLRGPGPLLADHRPRQAAGGHVQEAESGAWGRGAGAAQLRTQQDAQSGTDRRRHGRQPGACFYWCFYFRFSVWKNTFSCIPGTSVMARR